MGKIISYLRSMVLPEATVSEWAKKQWPEAMKLNAVRINQKRKYKIPDQPRYGEKIAGASTKTWGQSVPPNYISKKDLTAKDIIAKHARHIEDGYHKWEKNSQRMYETVDGVEAKLFKERIDASAEHYAQRASIPLRLTGDRVRWCGPAVLIPKWIAGDDYVVGLITATDKMDGTPINIVSGRRRKVFISALEQLLVQSGVMILNQKYAPEAIDEENQRINETVNGFCDKTRFVEFTPGGPSHCDFVMDNSLLWIEVQVTEK